MISFFKRLVVWLILLPFRLALWILWWFVLVWAFLFLLAFDRPSQD
jgi:hypothetical protein